MKSPLIYVSGPITTGDTIANIRAAINIGCDLIRLGYVVIVPHEKCLLTEIVHPMSYDEWLAYDFKCIDRCDAVLRIEGASKGGDLEVDYARKNAIPVFFTVLDLFHHMPPAAWEPLAVVQA
jgi:hypothetical protein